MELEADIMRRIQMRATELGARVFRNNTGTGWQGDMTRNKDGSITIRNPRPLHAGLCRGSSDLIGWAPMTITPEMVGRQVAVFTALEVKRPKQTPTAEQKAFATAVSIAGGVGEIIFSEAEIDYIMRADPTKPPTT